MLTVDRSRLLDGYITRFGPLTNKLADSFGFLLGQIQQDSRFTDDDTGRRQLAYCMATFKWETAHTMKPIDEFGTDERFNRLYGPQTAVGKMLGNTEPGDGARFHGRGYVQLTGRSNYQRAGKLTRVDLLSDPDKAKDPELAYQIAIQGMKDGWFTGRKLSQFINEEKSDFENARTIINGRDKADIIASIARRYHEILTEAL
ncbi:MAG: chitinase class family protein [Segetibacter sp.]|jgi:putative chitinase|nr:chitinase class family protein [Segetibacter sp.]